MSIDVRAIAHTGVTVRDLAAALDLWTGVLGFSIERQASLQGDYPESVTGIVGAQLQIAVVVRHDQRVELLQYVAPADAATISPRPCDVGAHHIALQVSDIDDAVAVLTARGWRLAKSIYMIADGPRAGTRLAYLHDDDGLTIEFVELPPC